MVSFRAVPSSLELLPCQTLRCQSVCRISQHSTQPVWAGQRLLLHLTFRLVHVMFMCVQVCVHVYVEAKDQSSITCLRLWPSASFLSPLVCHSLRRTGWQARDLQVSPAQRWDYTCMPPQLARFLSFPTWTLGIKPWFLCLHELSP